jgi:hypothetical protein
MYMARKGYSGKPATSPEKRTSEYEPYADLNSSTGSMLAGFQPKDSRDGTIPGAVGSAASILDYTFLRQN